MLHRLLATVLTGFLLLSLPLAAQEQQLPDYAVWNSEASAAEAQIDSGEASDQVLQALRADLVGWRQEFSDAQNINAGRIDTVKAQLDALGPAPAEGESEAEDVASRRAELNKQLSDLQAPGVTATEAYSRADAMIRNIDEVTRKRQTTALLEQSPSPLNPANWPVAFSDGTKAVTDLIDEQMQQISASGGLSGLGDRAVRIAGYLLVALGLIIWGRRWVVRLPNRLSARASESSRAAVDFLVSLAQIVLPVVGVGLLIAALDATGLVGERGRPILMALPVAGVLFFAGIWLAQRAFPDSGSIDEGPVFFPPEKRPRLRHTLILLMGALAFNFILALAVLPLSGGFGPTDYEAPLARVFTPAGAAVWHLPIILIGALLLFRLSNMLRRAPLHDPADPAQLRARVVGGIGTLGRIVAVGAVAAAAIGYVTLANTVLWSSVLTVAIALLVMVLQDFIADLYYMLRRGQEGARDSLVVVLIGFLLAVSALPFLALVWGARPTDLAEFWTRLQAGFSMGGIRLSPGNILTFLIVFAIGYSMTRAVQGVFRNSILPKTRLDEGAQNAAVSGLGYIGVFLAALLAISSAGIDMSSLAIVAGALSVGIGFGMQNIVQNFVSGIILLIERPVTVGDWINAGGNSGVVKNISVRSTRIQTFDRTDVIVPNSDLITQTVTNWTRGSLNGRVIVAVSVAYGSDTREVERILREVAEDQPTVMVNPPPTVLFTNFGADGLDFEIRAIVADINAGVRIQSDIRHEVYARLNAAGIEIPFAQRDIWLRNPEALGQAIQRKTIQPLPPQVPQENIADSLVVDDGEGGAGLPDAPDTDGGTNAG